MEQVYNSSDLGSIIEKALSEYPIRQGIIGILLTSDLGTVQNYEFIDSLYNINKILNYDVQPVILPPPDKNHFIVTDKDKMDALRRRVERDHTDGVRYNRLYIAVYTETPTDPVIKAHDIWFKVESNPHYDFRVTMSDNREGRRAVSETKSPEFIAAPMYLHADLNSKGVPVIKDQYGNELKPIAEDLVPRPFNLNDHLGNPEVTGKIVVGNSMKGVLQRVIPDSELPTSEAGESVDILFSRKSMFLRMDPPPTVGDVLKSNFGYDQPDSYLKLAKDSGLFEKIAKGVLNDKYPVLLTTILIGITQATNFNLEYWSNIHNTHRQWLGFNRDKDENR